MSDGDFTVPQSWPARIRLASALCASSPTSHTRGEADYCHVCLSHADLILERPDFVAAIVGAVLEPSMAWKGLFVFDPQNSRWTLAGNVTIQELEDRLRHYLAWEVSTMEEFCKDDPEALVPRQAVVDVLMRRRTSATPVTVSKTCICGPDHTGEDIDVNPDCPVHGAR